MLVVQLAEWEEQEEDEEDTEITNYDVGEEALDRLAIAMGGKTMVPVLFERIQELIKSTDWKHRHAALMAISQVRILMTAVRGCCALRFQADEFRLSWHLW